MKIYTKTGDKGETSLFGGVRVKKDHARIEAYGTVDELNSIIGLIRSESLSEKVQEQLIDLQKLLFHLGAELATHEDKLFLANGKPRLNRMMQQNDIETLEKYIDEFQETLPALQHFILPGGNRPVALCHLARTVCRRAERHTVSLKFLAPIREETILFLNRLSDYLFVLSRIIAQEQDVSEIKWIP